MPVHNVTIFLKFCGTPKFKGRLNERKQTVLRNNCRKMLTIRKNFGKHLRSWVCHTKFPIIQRFVSEKRTCYSSIKKNANTFIDFYKNLAADLVNRLPAAENISCINSVKKYYLALNIPSDSFKLQLTNKEEVFKIPVAMLTLKKLVI